MKRTITTIYFLIFAFTSSLFANEVNIFSARHYDSDVKIKRPLPNNKIEIWDLNELNKKHLISLLN